uniref:Aquaporin n=1 Tax=Panagrellus redivivus TaxID=6233 RepID=A0A7E4UY29_PANRE
MSETWVDKVRAKVGTKKDLVRSGLAEFIGTFVLVLVINSVVAQQILPKNGTGNALIGVNVGVGLGIFFGVALSAKASGGHINPAVTIAFLVIQQIKPVKALVYIVAQTLGAFFGAVVTYLVYYNAINAFDGGRHQVIGTKATAGIFASYPAPHLGTVNGLFDQVVGAAVFVLIILHVVDRRSGYPGWAQPAVIGTGFVMIGTAFAYNAGYPLNPARDFAPRLFTLLAGYGGKTFSFNNYGWFWVPIVGPIIGGILGALIYNLFLGVHGHPAGDYEVVSTREVTVVTHNTNEKAAEHVVEA